MTYDGRSGSLKSKSGIVGAGTAGKWLKTISNQSELLMVVAVANSEPWWEHTVEVLGMDLTVLFVVFGPFVVPLLIFLAVLRWIKPVKPAEEASEARKDEPQEPAGVVQRLETKEELGRRESQEWNAERLRRFGLVAHRRRRHHHHHHRHRHQPPPLKPGSEALCF